MGSKKNNDANVVHYGKRSWWDGSVTTECGLKFKSNNQKQEGWLTSVTCPGCKSGAKHKH